MYALVTITLPVPCRWQTARSRCTRLTLKSLEHASRGACALVEISALIRHVLTKHDVTTIVVGGSGSGLTLETVWHKFIGQGRYAVVGVDPYSPADAVVMPKYVSWEAAGNGLGTGSCWWSSGGIKRTGPGTWMR